MKYTAIINGDRLEIHLTRIDDNTVDAEIEGEKYVLDAAAVEPGVYWFRWKSQSIEISVTPKGETYVVSAGGRSLDVEIFDARNPLRKAGHHGVVGTFEIRAPMPGKVVKVLVEEGAAVEMNQGLVVIEAMKMQNEMKSPKQGIVRKVGVKESSAVNAGDLLAIVE